MVQTAFEVATAGPTNRKMPLEHVILERMRAIAVRGVLFQFPHISKDTSNSRIGLVHVNTRDHGMSEA